MLGSNRASYRRKIRARFYGMLRNARGILKENEQGRPFTGKGVTHKNGKKPFFPSQDPNVPNKVRVRNQRIRSGRIKEND
jgi:hypothetical protein